MFVLLEFHSFILRRFKEPLKSKFLKPKEGDYEVGIDVKVYD